MSKVSGTARARKREQLFRQQKGECFWCGGRMTLDRAPVVRLLGRRNNLPANFATFEHLRDRFHPGRTEPANGERRIVLACWRCNGERARKSEKENLAEQRRRSGRGVIT